MGERRYRRSARVWRRVGDNSVRRGGRGCAGRGCLFWIVVSIVLSVGLTILVNLIFLLFSGSGAGVGV